MTVEWTHHYFYLLGHNSIDVSEMLSYRVLVLGHSFSWRLERLIKKKLVHLNGAENHLLHYSYRDALEICQRRLTRLAPNNSMIQTSNTRVLTLMLVSFLPYQ